MKRRFLRSASLALVPFALAGSSLSYYSKEIRLQLFGTNQERAGLTHQISQGFGPVQLTGSRSSTPL